MLKEVVLGGVALFLFSELSVSAEEQQKLITDFNSTGPDSNGCMFGAFGPVNEKGNVCKESVQPFDRVGDHGSSVRIDYDVSTEGAYNGFWMKLGAGEKPVFDATTYKSLCFWIKGDSKAGFPYKFKVELKSAVGTLAAKKYVGDISSEWKKVQISLEDLAEQGLDLGKLSEFVIVFEQKFASPSTAGAIYIDDLSFEK